MKKKAVVASAPKTMKAMKKAMKAEAMREMEGAVLCFSLRRIVATLAHQAPSLATPSTNLGASWRDLARRRPRRERRIRTTWW